MLYVKREITKISRNILFQQNIETTWSQFRNEAETFLRNVASRGGVTEYRVILDNTTTTPDLIDRNVMYAKVYIKPARSIEFIAIDFIITRSGATLPTA
jgi:phage tail sheath protein FI